MVKLAGKKNQNQNLITPLKNVKDYNHKISNSVQRPDKAVQFKWHHVL